MATKTLTAQAVSAAYVTFTQDVVDTLIGMREVNVQQLESLYAMRVELGSQFDAKECGKVFAAGIKAASVDTIAARWNRCMRASLPALRAALDDKSISGLKAVYLAVGESDPACKGKGGAPAATETPTDTAAAVIVPKEADPRRVSTGLLYLGSILGNLPAMVTDEDEQPLPQAEATYIGDLLGKVSECMMRLQAGAKHRAAKKGKAK